MNIHEYQAKELLRQYNVPVPTGILAQTAQEAAEAAKEYGGKCVIKAQVHSGGRGKAGGVKLVKTVEEAEKVAEQMLGMCLVTKQTGAQGKIVHKVLVTEAVDVKTEYYLSVTGDNEHAGMMIVVSADGGVEIEETAKTHPEKIAKIPVSAVMGFKRYEGLRAASVLGLKGEQADELIRMLGAMVKLYLEKDCSLVEINPLVMTSEDKLLCLDAKINFEDNSLFRHPDVMALKDELEEDPMELRAQKHGLSYVHLTGNIGCLVNGAGLAMATMDIIKAAGGSAANFLDVGGSATTEKVKAAFEILLSDEHVQAIFVNIFGGIMKCDVIAEGVVTAAKETGIEIPLVVRLEGTNAERGKEILRESGLAIIPAADMADGVHKAVAAAAEYAAAHTQA
jgi:succinyl-CoA synthetase beta subunit